MTALLLIAAFAWISSCCGQVVMRAIWRATSIQSHESRPIGTNLCDRPLERFVFSGAIGLGIAAYGVYVIGMCGGLSFWPISLWWLALTIAGIPGMKIQVADVRCWIASWSRPHSNSDPLARSLYRQQGITLGIRLCVCVLVAFGILSIIASFQPPGAVEWDALAYHLADPKAFLQQHRISILPTEHHSNFPFTVETLFAVGLLYNGTTLANLFHLLLSVLATLGILTFGERQLGRGAGYLSAVLFTSTPIVFWEASVSYIDVGAALYAALASFAAMSAISISLGQRSQDGASSSTLRDGEIRAMVILAGITMGFALGVKYLALIPFVLIAALLLYRRIGVAYVFRFALIAVVIGAPWYVKNAVLMHNPVYPFYYRVFPNTRYWSLGREISYRSEQDRFGYPHSLSTPRATLLNLLEVPWRVLTVGGKYSNDGEYTFSALISGLFGGLCFAALLRRPGTKGERRDVLSELATLGMLQLLAWFFVAQIGRYLIQILPVLALIAGTTAARLIWPRESKSPLSSRVISGSVIILIVGNVVLVLCSVLLLPTGSAGARDLYFKTGWSPESAKETQVLPTALSVPEALHMAFDPSDQDRLLARRLDVYNAEQWLNSNTPKDAGVVLYEETRGLYLDRPYLWGNEGHSAYIPYEMFRNGEDVSAWMTGHGYHYAIINLNWSPRNSEHTRIPDDQAELLLREWYVNAAAPRSAWYRSVGDAIRIGLWTVVDIANGNVVLHIGERSGTQRPDAKVSHVNRIGRIGRKG